MAVITSRSAPRSGTNLPYGGKVDHTEDASVKAAKKLASAAADTMRTLTTNALDHKTQSVEHRLLGVAETADMDTTGFKVTRIPEGMVARLSADRTHVIRKKGKPQYNTIDYRSDTAVRNRLLRGGRRWGGQVTGSSSTCSSWAVPEVKGDDTDPRDPGHLTNVGEILSDLRSMHPAGQHLRGIVNGAPKKVRKRGPRRTQRDMGVETRIGLATVITNPGEDDAPRSIAP